MPASSIAVEGLSKQYRIGKYANTTLRERIVGWARASRTGRVGARPAIWALRGVSFEVPKGEVVGIIGRNGAGKSTLLKILSRITFPTAGDVKVRGRVASLLEVGVGFHNELTGRENVYLNGSILGMRKREVDRRFEQIVEFAGVNQLLDTQVKHYSSGMRLRLGFAVAAHLDPDILIVDEVLAVGDAGFQKKCLDAMDGLQSGGRTVLFVSHNMAAVENLCSRGIWIDDGKVRMDGGAKEVIAAYMASFADAGSAETMLESSETRIGNGQIRFTRLEYLAPDGRPCLVTRSGDPLVLRLHFDAKTTLQNVSFGFRLYTGLGTLITETCNVLQGISIPKVEPGGGYVDVALEALNLLPAKYSLSLWVTDERGHQIYDGDARAALEVEAANIYASGWLPDSRQGIVFFSQKWRQPVARR
ncbi:MAG: ABC transporter ATP-binding protein [Stellaceae bacterium]